MGHTYGVPRQPSTLPPQRDLAFVPGRAGPRPLLALRGFGFFGLVSLERAFRRRIFSRSNSLM